MDMALVRSKFARLGARAIVRDPRWGSRLRREQDSFAIDIGRDPRGEYFDFRITSGEEVDLTVVDVKPAMRHLLLMVRQSGRKDKFLCGHDERHWFVAAVPGQSASTVVTAMEALKPLMVRSAERGKSLRLRDRLRRRNAAFVRQGEWFFVPAPEIAVNRRSIVGKEPISRGAGSTPHMCERIYRRGGISVYVSSRYPGGLTESEYRNLLGREPGAKNWNWQIRTRDAEVYASGRVWHPDHQTIHLSGWHRVLMNRESEAASARNVVFLD